MSSPSANEFAPSTPKRAPLEGRDNHSEDTQKPPNSAHASKAPPTPTADVATNRTTAAPPLPGVSTPGRDSLGKRLQHLQLQQANYSAISTAATTTGSALTMSPIPAGSITSAQSPMRTLNGGMGSNAGTPTRHYALTPVANNTTAIDGSTGASVDYGDQANPNLMDEQLDFDLDNLDLDGNDAAPESRGWQPPRNLISPDDDTPTEYLLSPSFRGEHLQFPAELCNSNTFSARRPVHPGGPMLPPLAKRGLLPLGRKNSSGSSSNTANPNDIVRRSSSNNNYSRERATSDADPTKLPMRTFAPTLANLPAEYGTVQPILVARPCTSVTRAPELSSFVPMEDPVPFPTAASKSKGYSFTSMTQYEKRLHMEAASIITPQKKSLKQYQPSRQDQDLVAVGDIPEEELEGIFSQRRMSATSRNRGELTAGKVNHTTPSDVTPALKTVLSLSDQGSDGDDNDYQLALPGDCGVDSSLAVREGGVQEPFQAIPLDGRQFSIPSIRMAKNLGGGSVASCNTYYTDDDESHLLYRDDASLSSRGSFCNLDNIQAAFRISLSAEQQQRQQSSSFESVCDDQQNSHLMVPSFGGVEAASAAFANDIDDASLVPTPLQYQNSSSRRRSQKRKDQRDRSAYEWLHTVKAGPDEVAEAASSKFLNSGGVGCGNFMGQDNDLPLFREKQKKRLSATPGVESRAFATLKDL